MRFEKSFALAMVDMTKTDIEKAASWIIGNFEAQQNALNATLLKEVIEHFINSLWLQYVIVVLVGVVMVHANKYMWECLISI